MNKIGPVVALMLAAAGAAQAKNKGPQIPCEKVFVTGTQVHEITWALRGTGLQNNLYKYTCQEPVARVEDADAILDLEWDPKFSPQSLARDRREMLEEREKEMANGTVYVSCSSNAKGSVCTDSQGNMLESSCNSSGCSTYAGPNSLLAIVGALATSYTEHLAATEAFVYLFSARDHKLIWKDQSIGTWWDDLGHRAACNKRGAFEMYHGSCKAPTRTLD